MESFFFIVLLHRIVLLMFYGKLRAKPFGSQKEECSICNKIAILQWFLNQSKGAYKGLLMVLQPI
jgi:hypothetical protein